MFIGKPRLYHRYVCEIFSPIYHYSDVIMSPIASQITSVTIFLLNRSLRRRSKKISKLRVTGLCEGNSPVIGEFHVHRASKAENVSIWWRHVTRARFSPNQIVTFPIRSVPKRCNHTPQATAMHMINAPDVNHMCMIILANQYNRAIMFLDILSGQINWHQNDMQNSFFYKDRASPDCHIH